MSVLSGRIFVLVNAGVFAVCAIWVAVALSVLGFEVDGVPLHLVLAGGLGTIAAVFLVVGVMLTARYVEASIEQPSEPEHVGTLVIRSVMRRRRSVSLAEISRITCLRSFVLPGRAVSPATLRVVVQNRDGSVIAFTPREKDLEQQLARYGVVSESDAEPLTPRAAAHRYPGSVGVGERIASALPWIAVGLGTAVLVWGAVVALGR